MLQVLIYCYSDCHSIDIFFRLPKYLYDAIKVNLQVQDKKLILGQKW